MRPPALEIANLDAMFGRNRVLRQVELTVPAGTAVALLGRNGAGKTTVLRAVAGLTPVVRGAVRIHGHDVTTHPAHRRAAAGLCLIPQGSGVYRGLTVGDNLLLQGRSRRTGDAIERAVAAFPSLGRRLRQVAGTLSGGEQQMLALAAAHVRDPTLVLIDEASLGLAPMVIDEIFLFVAERARAGVAILLVEQFTARALDIATLVYVLRHGHVVHTGPAADVDEDTLTDLYLGAENR